MINLFNIPTHTINTADYSNLLHGDPVNCLEKTFAKYVGAPHAVSFNSATSAIFLLLKHLFTDKVIKIPTLIPPVVPNAIINSGNKVEFIDNPDWIGHDYILYEDTNWLIIDSAQKVEYNQLANWQKKSDKLIIIIYSFYPTKPVSGPDGGMIATNEQMITDLLRAYTMNGMTNQINNWERQQHFIGHKMYMNSIQADIILRNLKTLVQKKITLLNIRTVYNGLFGLKNTSDHLYRIEVNNQVSFIQKAKEAGITCGIHYQPAHLNPVFKQNNTLYNLRDSIEAAKKTVSIPFHEALTREDLNTICNFVMKNQYSIK